LRRQALITLLLSITVLALVAYSQVASILSVSAPSNYVIGSTHKIVAVYALTPPRLLGVDTVSPTFRIYATFMVIHGTQTFGQTSTVTTAYTLPVTVTQLCFATVPSTLDPGIAQITYSLTATFSELVSGSQSYDSDQEIDTVTFIKIVVSNGETTTITAVEEENVTTTPMSTVEEENVTTTPMSTTTTTVVDGKTYTITTWFHRPPHTIAEQLYTTPPQYKTVIALALVVTAVSLAIMLVRRYA